MELRRRSCAVFVAAILIVAVGTGFAQPGHLEWAKRAGGTDSNKGHGIATDGDDNSLVTGYFRETVTFGPGEPNETSLASTGSYDIFVAKYDPSGALLWAKRAGGTHDEEGRGIATDGQGNSLVTGYFRETATFGPGEPNETSLAGAGYRTIFVAKYDPSGALLWAKKAGGSSDYTGYGIATDGANNSLVTGYFKGRVTFDPGEPNETSLTSVGDGDIFVAKYDPSGALLWAKRGGGTNNDEGYGIASDGAGNSLVTGHFRETATFGAGEPNETSLTSAAIVDIFVAKYDPDGTFLWAKRAGGTAYDEGYGIATDGADNGLVTGYFEGTVTFGEGEPNETSLTSSQSLDIFVAKYDPSGVLLWAKKAGGQHFDTGHSIATDGADNSLVTGYVEGTAIFGSGEPNETSLTDPGGRVIFVAKYDPSGALLWAKGSGGTEYDEGHGIATDGADNGLVTGYFEETATFGPGESNETSLTSAGSGDIFVAKYSGVAVADVDGDGLADDEDNCPNDPNPDQTDADGDGAGDMCDNCPDEVNPDQEDGDQDGLGDVCDLCPKDPDNDMDDDGLCGDEDNCPCINNPGQEDSNNDGMGDACQSLRGDADGNCAINILDVLRVVNIILSVHTPTAYEKAAGDCNNDGTINIVDGLGIVNVVLGISECAPGVCRPRMTPETMEFLEKLKIYLPDEAFARFMALVKEVQIPNVFSLAQNYPNPFNPTTRIQYSVVGNQTTHHSPLITLKIYNLIGQEVRTLVDEVQEPGQYTVMWDGKDASGLEVASGLYFYRLVAGECSAMKRMVFMK